MKTEPQSQTTAVTRNKTPPERIGLLPIYSMSVGAFAIGTEGFMIAPLLPQIADDLALPVSYAALLITIFTLTLAISSPILAIATAGINRRALLIGAMVAFAAANIAAWRSSGFGGIIAARVLLALSAGLYLPNASAFVGTLVAPERRGRALAIVTGGATIAIALGLPLGSVIGHALGWRATFLCVGFFAAIAAIGLFLGVSKEAGDGIRVAGVSDRLRVAGQPAVIKALSLTFFWATGAFTVYPFIAPILHATVGFGDDGVSVAISVWGVSAVLGMTLGGSINDRFGSRYTIGATLGLLTLAFLTLAACAAFLSPGQAVVPVMGAIVLWGIAVWGFYPAQMAHLVSAGGPPVAPVTLSLNTSVMYAGFGVGSALGSAILASRSVQAIGLAAAGLEAIAVILFLIYRLTGRFDR
ncbi:putative MFS family arabinose efflux permease [Agrobacterium sp. RC10-4-1]|uniref:MFS transporter n=1 Tax=Agrobacterium sp. RC10-4-1 TaxID=2587039 RepID=UPI00114F8EE4|nr:MFS transporter [Agrobacterium sp. RC10-4-1]MBA8801116.1 putative MFS family arabinose efflux permease [Agrobacterium sp. RC10-4-1]